MVFSSSKKTILAVATFASAFICACGNESNVAGGVTDIGNSVSGTVVSLSGNAVVSARIVGYYDSWEQTAVTDSVEAVYSDSSGHFTIEIDTSRNIILYAENNEECVLSLVTQASGNKLTLGSHKSLESSIIDASSGYVRIVGTNKTAPVMSDGSFRFESIPPGDITITYILENEPEGYLDFKTTDDRNELSIPPMKERLEDGHFENSDYENDRFGVDFYHHDRPSEEQPSNDKPPSERPPENMVPSDRR